MSNEYRDWQADTIQELRTRVAELAKAVPVTRVTGRLEKWRVQEEEGVDEMVVWGDVYDDIRCRFRDGEYIHTSGTPRRELKTGDIIVTRNSSYVLGKPGKARDYHPVMSPAMSYDDAVDLLIRCMI